ncbi:hypothetical protein NDU88_003981 [Pleurodeles waltl]|uniref:Reverse transcriptase domain-containing protein n=1 Tax=Pleurodeles waltl TaxID=8319 RepID=A0AAV7T794_PLEWA|nr:hypothetical protein NDU88_003981 [Pleurodeles waltl]
MSSASSRLLLAWLLDEGKTAMLILLDLSPAFDTVSHAFLLEKLAYIRLPGLLFGGLVFVPVRGYFADELKRLEAEWGKDEGSGAGKGLCLMWPA